MTSDKPYLTVEDMIEALEHFPKNTYLVRDMKTEEYLCHYGEKQFNEFFNIVD